jgi:hypothetical protein
VTELIAAGCVLAYLGVAAWSMRWLYGRWRAHAIDEGLRRYPSLCEGTAAGAVKRYNEYDRGLVSGCSAIAGFLWPFAAPATLVAVVIRRLLETAPRLSEAERRAEQEELGVRLREREGRIRELERELGIGGNHG